MAQGNVEIWLGKLLKMSLQSVHVVIRNAVVAIKAPNFDMLEFLNTFPAQVHLCQCLLVCSVALPSQQRALGVHTHQGTLMAASSLSLQIGLLGLQIIWTAGATEALRAARTNRKIMQATDDHFQEILDSVIEMTTKELSKIDRTKFETVVTIHLHQRDIFHALVSHAKAFSIMC